MRPVRWPSDHLWPASKTGVTQAILVGCWIALRGWRWQTSQRAEKRSLYYPKSAFHPGIGVRNQLRPVLRPYCDLATYGSVFHTNHGNMGGLMTWQFSSRRGRVDKGLPSHTKPKWGNLQYLEPLLHRPLGIVFETRAYSRGDSVTWWWSLTDFDWWILGSAEEQKEILGVRIDALMSDIYVLLL